MENELLLWILAGLSLWTLAVGFILVVQRLVVQIRGDISDDRCFIL